MPFREINPSTRRRGSAESWLRRIFIDDWSLKLLALAITLGLWFAVAGREPQIEREVVVEPRIEGKPAAGYEVKEILVTPSKVRVQGPASHVNALQKASTAPISIQGRKESFDAYGTAIYTSDPQAKTLDRVSVHVSIAGSKPKPREEN